MNIFTKYSNTMYRIWWTAISNSEIERFPVILFVDTTSRVISSGSSILDTTDRETFHRGFYKTALDDY